MAIPPVRFHHKFFDVDWPHLSEEAQEALRQLLIRLQQNPLDTEVYKHSQESRGRYAYRFFPGWILYWHLDRDESYQSLTHPKILHIDVLAVEPEEN